MQVIPLIIQKKNYECYLYVYGTLSYRDLDRRRVSIWISSEMFQTGSEGKGLPFESLQSSVTASPSSNRQSMESHSSALRTGLARCGPGSRAAGPAGALRAIITAISPTTCCGHPRSSSPNLNSEHPPDGPAWMVRPG